METSELGARYCHICTPAPPTAGCHTQHVDRLSTILWFIRAPVLLCSSRSRDDRDCNLCHWSLAWLEPAQQPTATVRHFIFVRLEIISNSRSSGLMDTFCNFPICFYLPNWQFKGCHLPSVQLVKTVIQYEWSNICIIVLSHFRWRESHQSMKRFNTPVSTNCSHFAIHCCHLNQMSTKGGMKTLLLMSLLIWPV